MQEAFSDSARSAAKVSRPIGSAKPQSHRCSSATAALARAYVVLAGADSSRMADFIRRDTAQLLQDVPDATKETIIGALEVALEHRDWEEDRDDIYELLLRADVEDAALRCDKLAAAIGLLSDELLDDSDQEPAWVAVAVKLFVVGAIAALAVAARDELSWPMVGTVIALGAAAYALRGETLGDNEHV